MLVNLSNIEKVIEHLSRCKVLAVDSETTGLRHHHGDRLFGLSFYDGAESYYFDFNHMSDEAIYGTVTPLPKEWLTCVQKIFSAPKLWLLANAKFDMHVLSLENIELKGEIYDVLVMSRVENNTHLTYSLDACGSRIGFPKDDSVDNFIKKHKLWEWETVPSKKKRFKNKKFYKVPLSIMHKYAEQDVRVTYSLWEHQNKILSQGLLPNVVTIEKEVTPVWFKMEQRGIRLDIDYTNRLIKSENDKINLILKRYKDLTNVEFKDSALDFVEVFKKLGLPIATTEKGAPSFNKEVLKGIKHEISSLILDYRDSNKRISSYLSNFLYHSDSSGIVHCNIRQSATATGRSSIVDPALQTLKKDPELDPESELTMEEVSSIRKCFIPREGYTLFAIDYMAFEFRAMLDTCSRGSLVSQIESGLDVHQATASLVNITRKQAKTMNFGLIYGMGVGKLSNSLGVDTSVGRDITNKYFYGIPEIKEFLNNSQYQAKRYGYVVSRFGRRYRFPDTNFAYKAANCLIQGGTSDAVKVAMIRLDKLFQGKKSYILLQIHDELLFEIHDSEYDLIPFIKQIMIDAWPSKHHKMGCSIEYSKKSWAEMEEYGIEERNGLPS